MRLAAPKTELRTLFIRMYNTNTMAKFRKKPIVIEAIQLSVDNIDEIMDFCGNKVKSHPLTGIVIETLEGNMLASKGDYIIKGIKGEFYPCKPDIFEMTYEPVDS